MMNRDLLSFIANDSMGFAAPDLGILTCLITDELVDKLMSSAAYVGVMIQAVPWLVIGLLARKLMQGDTGAPFGASRFSHASKLQADRLIKMVINMYLCVPFSGRSSGLKYYLAALGQGTTSTSAG
jgi:hypothetical protein